MATQSKRYNWKDISSYPRNTKDRTPTTWELNVSNISRLVVTRHIHYDTDAWVMMCHGVLSIREYPLVAKDIEEAKLEAVQRATALLETLREGL